MQDLPRGGQPFELGAWTSGMLQSGMWRMAKSRACLEGSGAYSPDNIYIRCNLVRFGVYFYAIVSSKNSKNIHCSDYFPLCIDINCNM